MDGAADPLQRVPPDAAAVCVTGSTGYIGSWLVRSLLRRGYAVHAAARDLRKAAQLQESAWGCAGGHLKLFRADMDEQGSYDEAVQGCFCVFHVAAAMKFHVPAGTADVDGYVRQEVLQPVAEGTLNLMNSCRKAGSVKKVVFTSSISTATARDSSGELKPVVDESSLVSVNLVWQQKSPGWVYVLSKVVAEEVAVGFARENGMELIAIVPTMVAGPFITPQVPTSISVLLSPVTNDPNLHPILLTVHARLGSISVVHIDDLVDAHIFLMEAPAEEGRYLCSGESCSLAKLSCLLSSEMSPFPEDCASARPPPVILTKKLTDMGFKFKYGVNEILRETVDCCISTGFLTNLDVNLGC